VTIKTGIIEEHLLSAPDDGHVALALLEAAALRDCIVVQQAKPSSLGGHCNGGGDRKNALSTGEVQHRPNGGEGTLLHGGGGHSAPL